MELMECVRKLRGLNENASALTAAADGFDLYSVGEELADRVIRGTSRNRSSDEAMRSLADDLRSGAWRPKRDDEKRSREGTSLSHRLRRQVPQTHPVASRR